MYKGVVLLSVIIIINYTSEVIRKNIDFEKFHVTIDICSLLGFNMDKSTNYYKNDNNDNNMANYHLYYIDDLKIFSKYNNQYQGQD